MGNLFSRIHLTRFFLWISVISWGILLGAKLFDLQVLVGAWSASIPESLNLLPYGVRYPVDTGEFFIPSSAALLISTLGALISGWETRINYRILLIISVVMIFTTLVFTVFAFWPRNAALWAFAQGSPNAIKDISAIRLMVREWITFDWLRIAMGFVGFVAAVRAISIPFPAVTEKKSTSFGMKVFYGICISVVILFVIYFVSQI